MKRALYRAAVLLGSCLFLTVAVFGTVSAFHRRDAPRAMLLDTSEGLYCYVSMPSMKPGSILKVLTEDGCLVHTVCVDGFRQALLGPLCSEQPYQLVLPDGQSGFFSLRRNAAVCALSGCLRSDGERLFYNCE